VDKVKVKRTVTIEEGFLEGVLPFLAKLNVSLSDFLNADMRRFYTFLDEKGVLQDLEHITFREGVRIMDEFFLIRRDVEGKEVLIV
jgi:hypothetical protein